MVQTGWLFIFCGFFFFIFSFWFYLSAAHSDDRAHFRHVHISPACPLIALHFRRVHQNLCWHSSLLWGKHLRKALCKHSTDWKINRQVWKTTEGLGVREVIKPWFWHRQVSVTPDWIARITPAINPILPTLSSLFSPTTVLTSAAPLSAAWPLIKSVIFCEK